MLPAPQQETPAEPLEAGPIHHCADGHILVPYVEQDSVLIQKRLDIPLPVGAAPGLQHQIGIPAHHIQRVVLDTSGFADIICDIPSILESRVVAQMMIPHQIPAYLFLVITLGRDGNRPPF
ncbi:hypothetical protein D3C80_1877360 [compost metagenome]